MKTMGIKHQAVSLLELIKAGRYDFIAHCSCNE